MRVPLTNGQAAIVKLREESVRDYVRAAVAIVPKELHVRTESLDEMTDEELIGILTDIRIAFAPGGKLAGPRLDLPAFSPEQDQVVLTRGKVIDDPS